jgi:hypothetical protein
LAVAEGLVFDGLDLNVLNGTYELEALQLDPPKKRQEWAQGADADGASLVRDPLVDNRAPEVTVRINAATEDLALAAIGTLVDKIEETEKASAGLQLVWTPAGGTKTFTLYAISGEITALPITTESGWFVNHPTVSFRLDCLPFGYGKTIDTVADNFTTNQLSNYTADAGGSWGWQTNLIGTLNPTANFTTETRFIRNVDGYDGAGNYYDTQITVKHGLGSIVTAYKALIVAKRVDASNYVEAYVDDDGTNSRLRIDKVIAGVRTNLATVNTPARMNFGASYYLRARVEGNSIYAEHWTAAPTLTGTPAVTTSATLAGSDATLLGQGVKSKVGMGGIPQNINGALLDDFTIEPNVWVSTAPIMAGTLPGIPGDVAAEGVLRVQDRTSKTRRHFELGAEARDFDPVTSPPLLLNRPSNLTALGGTVSSQAGSYSTNTIFGLSLGRPPLALCSTGTQLHRGSFRVKARVYSFDALSNFRLAWQEAGGSQWSTNDWAAPPNLRGSGGWYEVDLGTINIVGTAGWVGRVEAYTSTTGTPQSVHVDYVELIPTSEFYVKGRSPANYETVTVFSARDEFNQSAGTLAGKTPAVGGAWNFAGSATDYTVDAATATATRSATADATGRYEFITGLTLTNVLVQADIQIANPAGNTANNGLLFRYTDTNNHAKLVFEGGTGGLNPLGTTRLVLKTVIAGSATVQAAVNLGVLSGTTFYTVRVVVDTDGRLVAWCFGQGGVPSGPVLACAPLAILATGGTLATGNVGLFDSDSGSTAGRRDYDNFAVSVPTFDAAIFSGRRADLRSDDLVRQDAGGTLLGTVPFRRGGNFRVSPAGSAGRTARIAARADRNDIEVMEDGTLGDSLQLQAVITPRYYAVPR